MAPRFPFTSSANTSKMYRTQLLSM